AAMATIASISNTLSSLISNPPGPLEVKHFVFRIALRQQAVLLIIDPVEDGGVVSPLALNLEQPGRVACAYLKGTGVTAFAGAAAAATPTLPFKACPTTPLAAVTLDCTSSAAACICV